MSFAQGKVVDPQHQRRAGIRLGCGADEPQQRRAACRAGQPAAQPGAGAAAQGQRYRLQHYLQAAGPPAVAGGQARHLLGERRLGAAAVTAEEPAGVQVNQHLLATARGISQPPLVPAVHLPRRHAAARAGRPARTGAGQHMHRPARGDDAVDGQAAKMRDQDGERFKIARRP